MTVRNGKSVAVWAMVGIIALSWCAPALSSAQVGAQANPGEIFIAQAEPAPEALPSDQPSPDPVENSAHATDRVNSTADQAAEQPGYSTSGESASQSVPDPLPQQERRPLGSKPDQPDSTDSDGTGNRVGGAWMIQTALALVVVIGLIYLTRIIMRKMAGQAAQPYSAPIVEVLSRTPIAPKTHVLLLKLNHRIIVAAQSSGQVTSLDSITDPDEVAQILLEVNAAGRNSVTTGFKSMLSKIDQLYQGRRSAELDEGDDEDEQFVDRTRHEMSGLLSRIRQMTR